MNHLSSHQWQDLLEALRRDIAVESEKSKAKNEWAIVHGYNARRSISLLQILNPKQHLTSS
jgi:hypothetical protein